MPIGEINRQDGGEREYTEEEKEQIRKETHDTYERGIIQNSPEQKRAEEIYAKLNTLKSGNKDANPTPEIEALEEELNKAVHAVNELRWAREKNNPGEQNG